MYEDGRPVDSMRVIVGKPDARTPTIASQIYYATLNPYWNVPVDLAQSIIAPNVLKYGVGYLKDRGYEVLDGFHEDAQVISPSEVDWEGSTITRKRTKNQLGLAPMRTPKTRASWREAPSPNIYVVKLPRTLATSRAASVPVAPIAMPTWAARIAGASLIPSPTMPTILPWLRIASMIWG